MDDLETLEAINRQIARMVGGDKCHSRDHLMRVPGPINLPNAKKRAAGKSPAATRVISLNPELRYRLEDFSTVPTCVGPAASALTAALTDVDGLPANIGEFTRKLIRFGDDLERPRGSKNARYQSRSECVHRVTNDCVRAGCNDGEIAAVLLNPSYGISASILEKRRPQDYVARQIESAREKSGVNWADVTSKGTPKGTYPNTILAIRRLEISATYDRFHRRKYVGGRPLQSYQGELTDHAVSVVRQVILETYKFDPGKDHVRDALEVLCLENEFHPLWEYLSSLRWDGVERLPTLLMNYFGAEDTPLNRVFGQNVMVAAVRRVRHPGTKFDYILVLEGPQGTEKSSAILVLAGEENFSDQNLLALDPKAQMEALEGIWLYELSELEGLSKADTAKIKAFASRTEDRSRPAYGRFRENRRRETIFIGTTNEDRYLTDPTGNRRFWPVQTGKIDIEALRRDRDQLWAEAAAKEARGASIMLPKELWPVAAEEQERRMVDDGWFDLLAKVKGEQHGSQYRVSSSHLLTQILEIPIDRVTPAINKRLIGLMRRLGWNGPKLLRFRVGSPARGYERSDVRVEGEDAAI